MNKIINIVEINDYTALKLSEFIFTTKEWLSFLEKEKKGKPLVLKIIFNNKNIFFVSLLYKNVFKMCGSPFEGWNTPYMGFINLNLLDDDEKEIVIKKVVNYLKHRSHCSYIQICDWNIDIEFAKNNCFKYEVRKTYFKDISNAEDILFAEFKNDVRTNHRAFIRNGLRIKIAEPSKLFMEKYYDQLIDVFKKRQLVPHYHLSRLYNLIDAFTNESKHLFLEQVYLEDESKCIATGIFLIYKKRLYFFGAASYRDYQILRPNEEVIWNAIRHAKSLGCTEFDMMGLGKYKEKFKPEMKEIPVLYFQRLPFLHFFKKLVSKRLHKRFK